MDATDPFLIVAASSIVAVALAPLVSRAIAAASADRFSEFTGTADDLSRIRHRSR